jgi:flagellar biosynthesis protein FlhB
MADKDSKTHDPSAKRLEDARRRGEVAVSSETRHAVMLGTILLSFGSIGAGTLAAVLQLSAGLWSRAGTLRLEPGSAATQFGSLIGTVGRAIGPLLGLFLIAALATGALQGRPTLSWTRLSPKWSKLNPFSGFKRMFGPQGWVEFGKTLAKTGAVLLACVLVVQPHLAALPAMVGMSPDAIGHSAEGLVRAMVGSVLTLVIAIAAVDWFHQHRDFFIKMRMSLQELKDEHRESEGDPKIKAKQRQLGMARARSRMMAAVPGASVIITNPTHFAVALRYEHGEMRAPVVVAKGVDTLAFRIRAMAEGAGVPVVESPPLARALYASAEIERPIPIEHYAAVAEVISFVMGMAKKRG